MKKFIFALMILSSPVFAQWQMPARQITNSTSSFGFIPTTNYTVQRVFDWADDEFARINTVNTNQDAQIASVNSTNASQQSAITNLQARVSTNEVAISNLQASVTSIGTNLIATQSSYLKGTNITGASYSTSSLTWTINADTALIDTNIFGSSYSNVNQGFTFVNSQINSLTNKTTANGAAYLVQLIKTNKQPTVEATEITFTNYTTSTIFNSNLVQTSTSAGTVTVLKNGLYLFQLSTIFDNSSSDQTGYMHLGFENASDASSYKFHTARVGGTGVGFDTEGFYITSAVFSLSSNTSIKAVAECGVAGVNSLILTNRYIDFSVFYLGDN